MSFTSQEKAQILAEYYRTRSVTTTKRWVRRILRKSPPSRPTTYSWYRAFQDRVNLQHRRGNGRRRIEDDVVQRVQDLFSNHPRTSIRNASEQIGISTASIHCILRRKLFLFPYKLQNRQQLTSAHKRKRMDFAEHCRTQSASCEDYLSKIGFFDECTFRLNGIVNRQNVRIWGTECPHVVNEVLRHGEKVTVWCLVSKYNVIGTYFFDEETVTGENYWNMIRSYTLPRLNRSRFPYVFQQDGAISHSFIQTRHLLNNNYPNGWIGRGSEIGWPSYSPDLTPCIFFFGVTWIQWFILHQWLRYKNSTGELLQLLEVLTEICYEMYGKIRKLD